MSEWAIYITLILREDSEMVLSDLLDSIDAEEKYNYFHTNTEVLLENRLEGASLSVRNDDLHAYSYNKSIILFHVLGERLERSYGRQLLDSALAFVPYLYRECDPEYMFGMHDWRIERIGENQPHGLPSPITEDGLADRRIEHPTWLMLFPPAMVETYGRDWLLDLPAETVEEFDDGAIMTVATESILDHDSPTEIAEAVNEAMAPIEDAFEQRDL
ncbi:hypothetical protein ACFQJ7_17145 [Halovenus rubra]|uniref:Uncharacterized protein n=2 Tax=Halovenus rubra TaxID=869890 RepID=A0ACC7E0I3_9EURY|nr:hypothetical protein [Halovenus rubra]